MAEAMNLADYKKSDFLIPDVDIISRLGPVTINDTVLTVKRNGDHKNPLVLNAKKMKVLEVTINDRLLAPEEYTQTEETLTLRPGDHNEFTVRTLAEIDPKNNTQNEGLYPCASGYFTQCEAEGFRLIAPMLDRPDVMARYKVTLIGNRETLPVLLSNGNPGPYIDLPGGLHMRTWSDPHPKPTYLFAIVAGKLKSRESEFITTSGRRVQLGIWAEERDLGNLAHAETCLKSSMTWDQDKYGREYDLDVFNIAVASDFNMGAMENKGLNVFNNKYVIANPKTQTDSDYKQIDRVIAHEYFHNWTGDRVTCRDWFQLCVKEGLTVLRDQLYSEDMGSPGLERIDQVRLLRDSQFREDAGPLAHFPRPESVKVMNNFYTATIYNKGAEIIRAMRTMMGPAKFREAMDLYFERHDGEAVTIDQFAQCMVDKSKLDLSQYMLWYSQAGTPQVDASWTHDTKTGRFELTLKQTPPVNQPDNKPMHIPVAFGLVGKDGQDLVRDELGAPTQMLHLKKPEQTFVFEGIPEGAVPSILRNFSAPVILTTAHTDEHLRHLMRHDSDDFNRWEAGREFMTRKMATQIERVKAGKRVVVDKDVSDVYRELLAMPGLDDAFRAEMLSLPDYQTLVQRQDTIDHDATVKVMNGFSRSIGKRLFPEFKAVFIATKADREYVYEKKEVARRTLHNTVLGRMVATNKAEVASAAYDQFQQGDNMTDCLAAFNALAGMKAGRPLYDATAADFYARHEGDALAIDKWFTVQAASTRGNPVKTVSGLMKHKDFSDNANRVRSLIGTFANSSKNFHSDQEGSGYRLVADFLAGFDKTNPQVASRIVNVFEPFKRYDETRQDQMEGALGRIAAAEPLSPDMKEKLEIFGILPADTAAAPVPG